MSTTDKKINAALTIKKLDKKIKKWISNWVSTPTPRELFLEEPMNAFTNYLSGQAVFHTLGDQSENLATWHLINYQNTVLSGSPHYEELAYASFHYGQMLEIKKILADSYRGGSMLPAVSALSLSLSAVCGWKDEFSVRFNTLKNGLDTKLLHLRKNEKHEAGKLFRHFWFLLELYAKSIGKSIDTSPYSYPTTLSPYEQVLQNWDTSDQNTLQELISRMADFNLSQTISSEHEDVLEFDYEDRMLFPYEILAFLRVREWANLENPLTFDHPLMQHPLAQLPPTLNMPNSQLFKDVIDKFKKDLSHEN